MFTTGRAPPVASARGSQTLREVLENVTEGADEARVRREADSWTRSANLFAPESVPAANGAVRIRTRARVAQFVKYVLEILEDMFCARERATWRARFVWKWAVERELACVLILEEYFLLLTRTKGSDLG